MSNCTALEIVDDKYRLITSDASYHGVEAFGDVFDDEFVYKDLIKK